MSIEQDVAPHPGPTTATSRAGSADLTLEGVHVLVVEDDEDARDFIGLVFERAGATVSSARSVADAWTLLTSETSEAPVDLLVSDIGLPIDDGYVLIERLRERKGALGDMPAIALTAYVGGVDRAHALRSGFDAHTPKPVQAEQLIALAARVLAQNPRRSTSSRPSGQ